MAKVVYHCYGGSHSSVTAAGIHLGLLPRERTAQADELLQVPHFDQYEVITHGQYRFIGHDKDGNEVFVLGKRTAGPNITVLLYKIAELFGHREKICPVDTTKPINLLMVVGGFFSRGLNMVAFGRPLVLLGTRFAYPFLVRLVEDVQQDLEKLVGLDEDEPVFSERRALFYICPDNDPLPHLVAALHLEPELTEKELLDLFLNPGSFGSMGMVHFLGKADDYELYLLGAGREPEITARILRELRTLIGIPSASLVVAEVKNRLSSSYKIITKLVVSLGRVKIFRNCAKAFLAGLIGHCRRERYRIRLCLKEGILD